MIILFFIFILFVLSFFGRLLTRPFGGFYRRRIYPFGMGMWYPRYHRHHHHMYGGYGRRGGMGRGRRW